MNFLSLKVFFNNSLLRVIIAKFIIFVLLILYCFSSSSCESFKFLGKAYLLFLKSSPNAFANFKYVYLFYDVSFLNIL